LVAVVVVVQVLEVVLEDMVEVQVDQVVMMELPIMVEEEEEHQLIVTVVLEVQVR
jgi:hypothetical protein